MKYYLHSRSFCAEGLMTFDTEKGSVSVVTNGQAGSWAGLSMSLKAYRALGKSSGVSIEEMREVYKACLRFDWHK